MRDESEVGGRKPEVVSSLEVDPESLSRDELVALVHELRSALKANGQRPASPRAQRGAKAVRDADYTLVFDGGSLGNPGKGYGSYEVLTPDGSIAARQLEFGDGMTNNQAEFRAVIAGLEDLLSRLGADAAAASLAVRGDSQLVVRGLAGEWKVKHPGLLPLHRQAGELLRRFGSVDLAWHPRRESVRAFGH
jgi:ribonuclease HI